MITKPMIETYITWRNYFNKGWGEFSWIRAPVERVVALVLLAKLANFDFVLLLIAAVIGIIACFAFGYWWDKKKAYEIEANWGFKRSGLKHLVKR